MPPTKTALESATNGLTRNMSDCSLNSKMNTKTAYPKLGISAEKDGFDCGKCGARCPPTDGKYHNISPHLFCFYADIVTNKNMFKITCESDRNNCKARLESSVDSHTDKFLTALHLCNKFSTCNYCVLCFQRHAPEIAKNEANNVCRYYNIGCHAPVFHIDGM